MTEFPPTLTSHAKWLSQGDVFARVPVARFGIGDAGPAEGIQLGPALVVTHDCAIDKKKSNGNTRLEYLTLVPLLDVNALEKDRRDMLREHAGKPLPHEAMYLGQIEGIGESYIPLTLPYTIPALMLRCELQDFSAAETGEAKADRRIVPTMHDTRVATLTPEARSMFHAKWIAFWTRVQTKQQPQA